MKVIGIIPARYASTRFPGKPLAKLGGKYVIQRVIEQVQEVLDEVWVATDDERIYNTVESLGANVVMTRSDHQSGTDRIAEALEKIGGGFDVVINIQGDEPFIQKSQIETVISCFEDDRTQIATLGKRFESIEAARNPNSPKIILDNNGYAMYFTRALAPYIRGKEEKDWLESYPFLKHIGLYAYRSEVLRQITKLPQSSLELAEGLEQLRWLQNGYRIQVGLTDIETVGIDTPEDLSKAEEFLAKR
ncbi:3-deoxy-manno-octulosonate cytidylyltransferase [Prevotella sp. HUN102]|uniref:3-deoxy-manno-octulosonate cytidylyltransferase n=1 Tax=Prevotella sp. HUN102 TaxID=1392486 RepID=UPI00049213A9|nr:3-deoxy-manno-octulosonate cytidylyltransferase [Prevotella sp. HUN102]